MARPIPDTRDRQPEQATTPTWGMRLLMLQLVEAPVWMAAVLLLVASLLCHLEVLAFLIAVPLALALELWLYSRRADVAARLERWARRYGPAAQDWHDRTWEAVFHLEERLNAWRAQPLKLALILVAAALTVHCLAGHGLSEAGGHVARLATALF